MALETVTKPAPTNTARKQIDTQQIMASFQEVGDDIGQISRLMSEENLLIKQFFSSLHSFMQPITSSVDVSTNVLPVRLGDVTQASMDLEGRLTLTFSDKSTVIKDLHEAANRDLLLAITGDVISKLNFLARQSPEEEMDEPEPIKDIPAPQPPVVQPAPPTISAEAPVALEVSPPSAPEPPQPEVPALSPEELARRAPIEAITSETLTYLEMLGTEVFEQAPVSKYFDDWMVNLRQVILSFESNTAIGPEETFAKEYNEIFGKIEDELANRQATEASIEVSLRTIIENRYILNKIDEGYAAQSKELIVKGKSAIDYLIRNVHALEKQLTEANAVKVSYRHPLKKMEKDQKVAELTQKLNAARKRLALAVGNSSVDKGKAGDIDAEYEAQTKELEEKRKIGMEFLAKNVQDLQTEIDELKKVKTLNPIKKLSNEQRQMELLAKLDEAKKQLHTAEQNHSVEQEKLRAEYEKKKQAALGKVQTLEKDVATKAVDNSVEVRKIATKALTEAVQARAQRKTTPTTETTEKVEKP